MQNVLSGRMFRTRGGAMLAGIIAAFLAALLLIIYIKSYRSSVNSSSQPVQVLVAKALIPQGTSTSTIVHQREYQVTTVRKDQLLPFAITNSATLTGQIAAQDINPGAQLTVADFTTVNASEIPFQITAKQRALAIPVDTIHGLLGEIAPNDYVDVYIDFSLPTTDVEGGAGSGAQIRLLQPDVKILRTPDTTSATGTSSSVVLLVNTDKVPLFLFAADNAKLWLVLRPQVGASKTSTNGATLQSLLTKG